MPPRARLAGSRVSAQPERRARAAKGAIGADCRGGACVLRGGEGSQGPLCEAGLRRETMAPETQGRPTEEPGRSSRAKQLHGEAVRGEADQGEGRGRAKSKGQGPQGERRPGGRAPEAALGEPTKDGERRGGRPKESAEARAEHEVPADLSSLHRKEGLFLLSPLKVHVRANRSRWGGRRRGSAPRETGPRRIEEAHARATAGVGEPLTIRGGRSEALQVVHQKRQG